MIVRIRGLHKVRSKGRVYLYHRRTGQKIQADPNDAAAILLEVQRLDGLAPALVDDAKAGTLGGLIAAYRASPEFLEQLKPRTRKDYQRVFDYLKPMAPLAISELTKPRIIKIRDKAFKDRKRRFANYVVTVLSLLFSWGEPRDWGTHVTGKRVPLIRRPKGLPKTNRPWTDEEFAVVMAHAKIQLRVAIAMGAHACLREGDVAAFPVKDYDGAAIQTCQAKTGDEVWIPAHRELRAVLDEWLAYAAAQRQRERKPWPAATTLLVNEDGLPYTVDGLRTVFFALIRKLKKAELVRPGLTFHGLRHTAPTKLSELGLGKDTIKSITGHRTDQAVSVYVETANRKKMARAAIKKLEGMKPRRKVQ